MYLISAYFDDETNKILNRYIYHIAEQTGNTFMTDNNVPPHITISSIEARCENVLLPGFSSLKGGISMGTLQIVSVGQLFPYVMYIAPVMNQYLSDLSKQVYEAYQNVPETKIGRYYKPLSWLPHITLGKTLTKEQMHIAFQYLLNNFQPMEAKVVKLGLARVNPHEDIDEFLLSP